MVPIVLLFLVVTYSTSTLSEDNTRCRPENKHLFAKFLLQRWSDIRKEIGLTVDPFNIRNPKDEFMLHVR